MLIRTIAVLVSFAFLGAMPADAQALDKVERVCAAKKLKATAKKTMGKLKCETKAIIKELPGAETECLDKAEAKFSQSFTKAEEKGGCVSDGDATAVEAAVDSFVQAEVSRQKTGTGPLPTCSTLLMPCGSCGSGVCVAYTGGGQVCVDTVGVITMCTTDAECTSPQVCVNAGGPSACATPCP